MSEKSLGNRVRYIEYLRVFCMLCVVLIHTCVTAVTDFPDYSFENWGGVLYYSIRSICHFAVPHLFYDNGDTVSKSG